jgi:hypothetical protein
MSFINKNIKNKIYSILDSNSNNLLLKNLGNKKINYRKIDEYTSDQACVKKYINFMKKIFKKSTYIDVEMFNRIYKNNIEDISRIISNDNSVVIMIIPNTPKKSNYFLSFHTLEMLKKNYGLEINYIFENVRDIINEKSCVIDLPEHLQNKNVYIVLCDDVSYSGNQLANHLNKERSDTNPAVYIENGREVGTEYKYCNFQNVKFILNVIGYTKNAKKMILLQFRNPENVIFPESSYYIDKDLGMIVEEIAREEGKDMYELIAENDLFYLETEKNDEKNIDHIYSHFFMKHQLNQYLIYIFFKYPDDVSTITDMCRLENFGKKKYKIFDMEKFGTRFGLDIKNIISAKYQMSNFVGFFQPTLLFSTLKSGNQYLRYAKRLALESFSNDCQNLYQYSYKNYIPTMDNISHPIMLAKDGSCENNAIVPFYKKIEWNEPEPQMQGGYYKKQYLKYLRKKSQK